MSANNMRKLMNGLALLALLLLSGCASLGPQRIRTEQRVTNSRDWVERTPGDALPVTARWEDGVLRAEVEREVSCRPMRDQTVELRQYSERQVRGLGGQVAGSFLMLGVGIAAAIATATLAENEDPNAPDDETQPYHLTFLVALGAIPTAAYGFYRSIDLHQKSLPMPYGRAQTEVRSKPNGPATRCEPESIPAFAVVGLPSKPEVREFKDGKIALDFTASPELCPDEVIGKEVMIGWKGGEGRGILWRGSLDDCAYAHRARLSFMRGRDSVRAKSVPRAVRHYEDGTKALAAIGPSYTAHSTLTEEAGALREMIRAAVPGALQHTIEQLEFLRYYKFSNFYEAVTDTIVMAEFADGGPIFWAEMYRLVIPAITTPADLRLVLSDPSVVRCLGGECKGMTRDEFLELFSGMTQSVDTSRQRLESALRSNDLTASLLNDEQPHTDWCTKDGPSVLNEACDRLFAVRRQAWVEISKREERELRVKSANTAKEWRAQFSTCRKVAKGIEAFRGIGTCGADCQRARTRLLADHDALRNFSPTMIVWETSDLEKVRAECRDAGCPRCP